MMTQADWDKAIEMRRNGTTAKELAEMFGVSYAYMKEMTRSGAPERIIDYGTAQALRNAGWSIGAVAKELKTTKDDIAQHTRKPVPKKKYDNEWNVDDPIIMIHNEMI